MANSENAKLKLLYLYYYFMQDKSADSGDTGASMSQIISYLQEKTGTEFERKSIYADIARLNKFAAEVGMTDPGEEWITIQGKKYYRGEVKGELTLDEARLIVDAVNTTDFIDSGICEKIKKMYPSYFRQGYKSVISHDDKSIQKPMYSLNSIRTAIEEKLVLEFRYGYVVASGIRAATKRIVSPLALDFEKSHYYLIAVDNEAVSQGAQRSSAIKRYRFDRMRQINILHNELYMGFENDKDKILEKYLKNSVDAFSSTDSREIRLTLRCGDERELLRAFTGLTEDMKTKILSDRLEKGEIRFTVKSGIVPPLFSKLFKVSLYNDVELIIDDDEVRSMYEDYLKSALLSCGGKLH